MDDPPGPDAHSWSSWPRAAAGPGGSANRTAAPGPPAAGIVTSNVLRADYAGSQACAGCHPTIHRAWQQSPMHRMTRDPERAEIRAPFDGGRVPVQGRPATFERHGDQRFMQVRSPAFGDHLYRVTRVIGGRHREDFAGLEVAGTAPGAPVIGDPTEELVLPVSYVFDTRSFRLKGYSVMVGERPGLRAGGVWNQTCVVCHNTLPQFESYWSARCTARARRRTSRCWSIGCCRPIAALAVTITDAGRTGRRPLRQEIRFLGGRAPEDADPRELLAPRRAHHPGQPAGPAPGRDRRRLRGLPRRQPRARRARRPPAQLRAAQRLPARSRPRQRRAADAAPSGSTAPAPAATRCCSRATRTPGRAACARSPRAAATSTRARRATSCWAAAPGRCPAPPATIPTAAATPRRWRPWPRRPATAPAPAATTSWPAPPPCGRTPTTIPAGAGGSCVACHMPRKNMGLGYELTRYHRIGSPTDRLRVEGDRPLECALCHPASASGRWSTPWSAGGASATIAARSTRLYGDLRTPVLQATVTRGMPHEQATAMAVLGEQRVNERRAADRRAAGPRLPAGPLLRPPRARTPGRRAHRRWTWSSRCPRCGRRCCAAGPAPPCRRSAPRPGSRATVADAED